MPADYTVSLKCATNDGEDAMGVCHVCRHPVCDLCVATREGDALVCRRCVYQEVEAHRQVPTPRPGPERASREWRLMLGVLALSATDLVLTVNIPEQGTWLAFSIVNTAVALVGLMFILIHIRIRRLRLYLTVLLFLNAAFVLYDLYQHTMLSLEGP